MHPAEKAEIVPAMRFAGEKQKRNNHSSFLQVRNKAIG
jgi:hypothetical protein